MVVSAPLARPAPRPAMLPSSSVQLSSGREESSSVNQGRLVSGHHIPCFCLSPPASAGASTICWHNNSALTSNSDLSIRPRSALALSLAHVTERPPPQPHAPDDRPVQQRGGGWWWWGVDVRKEEGDKGGALQCFPFSSF